MLRVNRAKKELVKLENRSLFDSGLTEPYDLQQMIRNSAKDFEQFLDAVNGHLQTVKFSDEAAADEVENEEEA